jgi:hypothetical protein
MKDDEQMMQGMVMDAEIECRAWTALAEIGMRVVEAGFSSVSEGEESGEQHIWAQGIEGEVCMWRYPSLHPSRPMLIYGPLCPQIEQATSKGLQIAQKVRI